MFLGNRGCKSANVTHTNMLLLLTMMFLIDYNFRVDLTPSDAKYLPLSIVLLADRFISNFIACMAWGL